MRKCPIFRGPGTFVLALLTSIGGLPAQTPGPQPPTYAVVDLGTLGYSSYAQGINASGQVVGYSTTTNNYTHGFLYANGSMQDIGTLGGNASYALGINIKGQVVGQADTGAHIGHAFLYENGSMRDIGTLLASPNGARSINAIGQIAGAFANPPYGWGAFLYSNGSIQDIGSLTGHTHDSYAYGINDSGQVVGYYTSDYGQGAFLFANGVLQDLGNWGGNNNAAYAINNSGQVVGEAQTNTDDEAFLYSNGFMQNLGIGLSDALGINNNGWIVGSTGAAFLYLSGQMYDLNKRLVNSNSGWTLTSATAINDAGQIVGYGVNPVGQSHAFLLNPLPAGAIQAASMVQSSLPTYGSCPAPEPGKGLIVITHGWIPLWDDPAVDMAWVDEMSNSIVQYLDNNGLGNEWQVFGCKWPSWNNGAHVLTPTAALSNGEQYGKKLGDSIVALNGWSQIHFIAHSAGAGLIQKATEEIKATLPTTVIQCTFLDAFDGAFLEKTGVYGNQANWADSYFSRDSTREWTEQPLPHAYNVDVTTLDPQATQKQLSGYTSASDPGAPCYETESSHGWPIGFYSNTIAGGPSVYRWSDYNGFGWPLSEECDNWGFATSQYLRGNGVSYGTTMVLGPEDGPCTASLYVTTPAYSGSAPSFSASSTIQSDTGTLQIFPGSFKPQTDSPVWIATVITDTNTLNIVSFDAEFTSAAGADGLLSVYWDTNMIGLVDEAAVQPGFQHYNLSFPNAAPNTSHVLGFHLDPFSSVQSSMILTNIVTGCVGVSQPFSLSITANTGNGLLVYQLTGQPANYTVQASTDLLNWTNIAILANTAGTVSFTDPNSTNHPCCFYRAVAQ